MQVALAQLSPHLQRGLSPLYVLHGDEPLLQQEAADAIRATARAQGYTERSSYTVAGSHGYGFWERNLLGSVSDAVVHQAHCTVLVVRSAPE